MSIVALDGFDMYNGTGTNTGLQGRWTPLNFASGIAMATGRFGGQCVQFANSNAQIVLLPPSTYASFGHGIAFRELSGGFSRQIIFLQTAGGTTVVALTIDPTTGTVTATGPSGTLGTATGQPITVLNVWHYFEIYGTVNTSTGTCQVYLDGSLIINVTGQNTGSTNVGKITLGWNSVISGSAGFQLDDWFLADSNTHLGECKVETLRPASDSSVTWTPNSGVTNYSRVNETLVDGDTSYVSTASTGVRDLYTIASLSTTPANIYAANIVSFAEKTDATTRQLYNSVRSASTDSDGTAQNLAASYQRYDRVMNTDPATSAAWTASGVNNLLIGPKAA